MAKPTKKVKTADKWKKKQWFTVVAPKAFQERVLGETPTANPDSLKGRRLKINLMTLTANMKRQNVNVVFEVIQVQGERALTQVRSVELVPTTIRRRVGRNHDRIDSSFICTTKDGVQVRLKPLVITQPKTSAAVRTSARKLLEAGARLTVGTLTFDTLVNDVLSFKFQKSVRYALHKIVPMRGVEIRQLVRIGAGEPANISAEEAKNSFYASIPEIRPRRPAPTYRREERSSQSTNPA